MITAAAFFSGLTFACFAAAGIFFLKFWKASQDLFFLWFTIACWLLAIERIFVVVLGFLLNWVLPETEAGSWIYFIRLAAFIMISFAVFQKNRETKK